MESIIYVGMDVHKDSYSVCCYKAREDKFYYEKKILSESKRVIRYLEAVKKEIGEDSLFICGYEAGPTAGQTHYKKSHGFFCSGSTKYALNSAKT